MFDADREKKARVIWYGSVPLPHSPYSLSGPFSCSGRKQITMYDGDDDDNIERHKTRMRRWECGEWRERYGNQYREQKGAIQPTGFAL